MKRDSLSDRTKSNPARLGILDREPAFKTALPTGPFQYEKGSAQSSLLIFVPRNEASALIDELTSRYGYSHLAIDCGEIDIPSGKKVMIESVFRQGVHRSFQDEYGERKFVRIPLEKAGVNPARFCASVTARLGEKFDDEEVLSFGLLHDPSRQICSDLATVSLPEPLREDIAHFQGTSLRFFLSHFWPFTRSRKVFRLFVTPNGYARYFGAPRGSELVRPDQLSEPALPVKIRSKSGSQFPGKTW